MKKELKHRLHIRQKGAVLVISIVLLIFANYAMGFVSWRIDLSPGRAYTLSPASKKIITTLDKTVTINLFISSELPMAILPLKTDVVNLVNEYRHLGKNKVTVKLYDPKKDQKAQEKAKSFAIPELQFSQVEKDKYAVSASYFGIAVTYADKKEIIPQATNVESLEYDITSAIYKMARKNEAIIGFLERAMVFDLRQDPYYTLKSVMEKQYTIEVVSTRMPSGQPVVINPKIKTLLVFGGGETVFSDEIINALKSYLKKGNLAIFMVDGVGIDEGLAAVKATHNLFNFLKEYGLTLNNDFVLSTNAEVANFTSGGIGFFTTYPFWIRTNNFDKKNVLFTNVSTLTFPWAASIGHQKKNDVKILSLVKSEPNSWNIKEDNISLLPNTIKMPDKKQFKTYEVIAQSNKKNAGTVILIASSRFAEERFLAEGRGNIGFLINTINSFTSDGALSGIRARSVLFSPLKEIDESAKDPIKYVTILILPILLAGYGFYRLAKRQ